MKSLILASAILLASALSNASEPVCSITYTKQDAPKGAYVYQTLCNYGKDNAISQEMVRAWVQLPADTEKLLNDCESQCNALNAAHPNGF